MAILAAYCSEVYYETKANELVVACVVIGR